jgi:peptide/nickel transport system ATP-binding protein/oligopeptide transport system ATP-binding protein
LEDVLKTEDLFKWFPIRGGMLSRTKTYVRAVDGVSLTVRRGETLGLVGESGCGKTTLGRTIMRLTEPSKGSLSFEGEEISRMKGRRLKQVRRKMQMVFQDPYASLDPRQSVRSALLEPMKIHHTASSKREANREAERLIEKVGLNPDHLARFPHEFSGGQRQRIAIAIALAVKPSFIVLDEPTSSLDVSVQAQILQLLKELQRELGLTYVFISHNLAVIRQMCARTGVMYLGRIVELADTERLFANPKHPYTHALLSSVPIPDPARRKLLETLQGDVPVPVGIPEGCRFRTRCAFASDQCAKVAPPMVEIEKNHWIECHYDLNFSKPSCNA